MKFIFIISVGLLLLSGCGYHLKTQNALVNTKIVSNNQHTLVNILRQKLDTKKTITTNLQFLKIKHSEQVVTTNNQGQITSLRLIAKTTIKLTQIKTNKILFNGTLQQNQIIDISNNSSVDNKQKETTLQQLYNELAQQILFKINYEY